MRHLKKVAIALAATVVALAGVEALLRANLAGRLSLGADLDRSLRDPHAYTSGRGDEDYWKLFVQLWGSPRALPADRLHPVLGWTSDLFSGETFEHVDAGGLAGRRPVLLFGDSFTRCLTPREDCWAALLDDSDLGERYAILNYGVLAYGLDQMVLLAEHVVPLWQHLDPVVVFCIYVDDDLDRCMLSFRGWPKPRYRLRRGELELELPATVDRDEYLAQHPPGIASLLLRRALRGRHVPAGLRRALDGSAAREREMRALIARVLGELHANLDAAGLEHYVVLHEGSSALSGNWRERFLIEVFEELGVPFVSASTALWEHAEHTGHRLGRYYYKDGMGIGHYNAIGNRVVLDALRAGLEGRFEPYGERPPRDPDPGERRRAERRRARDSRETQ